MAELIRMTSVTKTYRAEGGVGTDALRGVDLAVGEGEFVAVMGSSGSGKSSLMNVIGLLDRDFGGEYLLDGADVRRLSASRLADLRGTGIGFVFQHFNLLPRTSVLNNVLLPTGYHRKRADTARAVALLERVGLGRFLDRRANQLSGGQMQRVAIARALVMRPRLILADEPTGNLDSTTAAEIMSLLQELHDEGNTILLITHEHDIADHARRVVTLRDGRIAA
ncbi:MAG: ABC transporter ATP-binding protein [Saccharothrix sp.]|nr:ABC transporter ATP-binding protein [Saccharothrix sp.]